MHTFVFLAGTLLTILATGSILMAVLSTTTRGIGTETSDVAADFSWTFLNATIAITVLIAVVFVLTGRKLPL